MDYRDNVIKEYELLGGRDADILLKVLQDYEITKRTTELIVGVNRNRSMLNKFIATKRIEGKSERTLQRYHDIVAKLLDYLDTPVEDITTYHLRLYLSVKKDEGLCDRTLDGMRKIYSSFFTWLNAEGFIAKNPCATLKPIKFRKEQKLPFSPVDMEKIKSACETPRDLALIEFLYSTGCRVSEISSVDATDIDFNHKSLEVLGKGNKVRRVYLSDVCCLRLQEYLNTRKDLHSALFVGSHGRLLPNGIRTSLRRIGERAGVEHVHPHRFRRTLATNLLDRGMKIQDVDTILGHDDLDTTQIYCYISQNAVEASYRKYNT